jgi:molecular chaperone GrpE
MSGQPEQENNESSVENTRPEAEDESGIELDGELESANADADPLESLRAKAEENWEKYVRAAAELENVRKRALRDVEKAHKYSLERFARELLAVRDSLELGLEAGVDAGAEALLQGSQATLKLMATTMEQFGISEVDPHGEPFNPELHEAMTMQPSRDVESGSVLAVFQKGYTLNGRLLRPALVVVAQDPPENSESD